MNILLVGGTCSLMNNIILKLRKEGHRVFLLTGDKYKHSKYEKVFERYDFPYDSENLNEIIESVNPDVTILLGAFDTNYLWNGEERETVHFISHMVNILVAYSVVNRGKLIYLSSDEVFSGDYPDDITEGEKFSGYGIRPAALSQAEELCENFRVNRGLDITVLRLDHLYSIPKDKNDINNICAGMCLEYLRDGYIKADENHTFSMLYEKDAVEYIYKVVKSKKRVHSIYHLSSNDVVNEVELASWILQAMQSEANIVTTPGKNGRCVLSGRKFEEEFDVYTFCDCKKTIEKMALYMQKHKNVFVNEDKEGSILKNLWEKWKWLVRALVPFIENLICFIPFFMLNNRTVGSQYFANLDPFLLYVLLFAIVYGQQQATFSAICAVAGYMFRQMYTRTGFEVLLDYNTYVWIAQLFILGLVVGYMRDQIRTMRAESAELEEHLSMQIVDIRDINESNVRVREVMEQQLVGQKDSLGKIYSITRQLDQSMPDKVVFHAVEMLTKLMETKDVAFYSVVNDDYARLFSASSEKARSLGNSIRYREMTEIYDELLEEKVYINKTMDERYPLMVRGIYEDGKLQMVIMLWGLNWEKMTLGRANFLTVVSYLIQNAVLRAQRYIQALEEKRYSHGSRILEKDAFESLVQAYVKAEEKNLVECTLLKVCVQPEQYQEVGRKMVEKMRDSDYIGIMEDDQLYVLLANTGQENAVIVQKRFEENGYRTEIVE